ncbi:MAG: hypothetical protein WCC65_13145 [Pseudonocardiaceae bacterium]
MENRFAPLTLPRWEPDADACSLLASFAASFPLRGPSPIATEEMAAYLLARSEGTIGELAHLLTGRDRGDRIRRESDQPAHPADGRLHRADGTALFERELA